MSGCIPGNEIPPGVLHLGANCIRSRTSDATCGRGTPPARPRRRRSCNLDCTARFDDERPRRDHTGDLSISEFPKQSPHVAIDRLLPQLIPWLEVAADQRGPNARVDRCGVESQQSAFSVAGYSDRQLTDNILLLEPIDRSEYFLYLVPDDVPPYLERHSIDPLPVRLVRHPYAWNTGPGIIPIHQDRNQYFAAGLRKMPPKLCAR